LGRQTVIAWCDRTFNPWMGCFKVSQGCKHCYAETLTTKKMRLDVFGPDTSKRRRTSEKYWRQPRQWSSAAYSRRVPSRVFCASLADVFEDARELAPWREQLWDVIHRTAWLDWLILTKRPENIVRMLPDEWDRNRWGYWPNVWLGTSIEYNLTAERSSILTAVPAHVHFISYEPAIGPGDEIPLDGIEWMICGGESGPGYRPMDLDWAHSMRVRCHHANVPYFFKQNSGIRTEMGIDALGTIVREYPQSWDRRR
jgi:protein gp37